MKTKGYIIALFLAFCLVISLPAIHEVATPASITMMGGGVPVSGSSYYTVGEDCVLYHAYWDGTAVDHSIYGEKEL